MIYELKKDDNVYEIDDNIFFDKQPKEFREAYNELKEGDTTTFDNALVLVLPNRRVIITIIESEVNNG